MIGKKFFSSGLSFLRLTMVVLAIDRASKIWAISHLTPLDPVPILPIFNLTLAYNRGAAFSFLQNASGWQNILLGGFALVVIVVVLAWLTKLKRNEYWTNTALALILAGAIGNVWDRMTQGYVTDFLDFHLGAWHFAIFNFADTAICIGAIMIAFNWLFVPKEKQITHEKIQIHPTTKGHDSE